MFHVLEVVLLRLVVWVGAPLLLLFLLVGPARFRRGWRGFWGWVLNDRHQPDEVIENVVRQHQKHLGQLQAALKQAQATEADIEKNIQTSDRNVADLEREARLLVKGGDDDGARAALVRQALEEQARTAFQEQLAAHRTRVRHIRRRLHQVELQLRQYEVGRSILLSQLAEARTVREQYALAAQFDPFSAVAQWQQAEGLIQDEAEHAEIVQQVLDDTADAPLSQQPVQLSAAAIEARLARLKEPGPPPRNGSSA